MGICSLTQYGTETGMHPVQTIVRTVELRETIRGRGWLKFSYTSVTYCFGIVYVYLVEEGYSNTQVAIIPAIMNGISNLLGPLSTGLTSHYSHRRVVCTGIMLVTVGLLLCSFFNNLVWFYLCYGVIIGVGGALIKPQGILLGQLYFDKKRATANGFSMVGMSLSLMTLPAVISYLVQEYSYPGAFLLWSAIVLHGIIGASLYHPVKWHLKKEKPILQDDATSLQHKEQSKKSIAKDTHDANDECEKVSSSETKSQHGDSSDSEDDSELDRKNIRRSFIDPLNSPKLNLSKMESVKHSPTDNFEVITLERKFKKLHDEKRNSRGSIYSIASSIRGGYDVVDELGSCASFMDKNMMQKNSLSKTHEAKNNEGEQHCTCCCLKLPKIHNMIKLSLLKHPAFIISSFSSIFNRMVYICFITYLPAIAKEKDIGKLAPLLLTCIAVFELLAKIIMSVISDCGWMPRRYFYIIGSFLASIAIICK
ncbi:hypothetical protein SK128_015739 [Halocaridina rubra]|uniref:Monocarboxylate transporter n=1 Tax=Halocaridina rubra TaxID=373956 RepID=A0AAN8XAQ1_HALRR